MAKAKEKGFDCVKWTREVRDQIYEETKHMTLAEYRQWLESRRPTHGALAKLYDRAKPPVGGPRRSQGVETADPTTDIARATGS